MIPTTTADPSRTSGTTPGRDRGAATAAAGLSLARVNLLRLGYAIMAAGLVATQWPSILNGDVREDLMGGVVTCMLVALSLMSFLGLRYPVQLIPVLLFESAWKLIWLTVVALPLWRADRMDPSTVAMTIACLWVVIVLAVVPWRFAVQQYVSKPGDPWVPTRG